MVNFWEEMRWRGQLGSHTPDIGELSGKGLKSYIGFDPTAASLTIGNLVTVVLLRRWQLAGNIPIVVMGGATGKIGDPSGKDQERQLLDYDTIEANIQRQLLQMRRLLDFEGECAAVAVNNADFYATMDVFSFLRDVGKNITINYMLSKDSVKSRQDQGMSFTEFSYQIIQGYDFQYLYQHQNCQLQMGGADQWGNITTGLEFIRKQGGHAHGMVCPLLTKADGKKFGKSESGNIWLDVNMTTPYEFYQFWLNANDSDLPKLWRTFSFKNQAEIEALELLSPQEQKRHLAEELTDWIHGNAARLSAQSATKLVFDSNVSYSFLTSLSAAELQSAANTIGYVEVDANALADGIGILDLLLLNKSVTGLSTNSEARRAIQVKAIAVNTELVNSPTYIVTKRDLIHGKFILLQNGRKKKFMVIVR